MDDAEAAGAHDGLRSGWMIRTYDRDGKTYIAASRGTYTVVVPDHATLVSAMADYDRYGVGSRLAERGTIEGYS